MSTSLFSSGALQQFRKERKDFFFARGCTALVGLCVDPARCALSPVCAAAICERLLLEVLSRLLRSVKLRLDPFAETWAASLAVTPLNSVLDEGLAEVAGTSRATGAEILEFAPGSGTFGCLAAANADCAVLDMASSSQS